MTINPSTGQPHSLERTLPRAAYQSPEVYRAEMDLIFSREWVLVARAEDVPAPGDYRQLAVAGESLLLVRDAQGTRLSRYWSLEYLPKIEIGEDEAARERRPCFAPDEEGVGPREDFDAIGFFAMPPNLGSPLHRRIALSSEPKGAPERGLRASAQHTPRRIRRNAPPRPLPSI